MFCLNEHMVDPGDVFCSECGVEIPAANPTCVNGHEYPYDSRFCPTCGLAVANSTLADLTPYQKLPAGTDIHGTQRASHTITAKKYLNLQKVAGAVAGLAVAIAATVGIVVGVQNAAAGSTESATGQIPHLEPTVWEPTVWGDPNATNQELFTAFAELCDSPPGPLRPLWQPFLLESTMYISSCEIDGVHTNFSISDTPIASMLDRCYGNAWFYTRSRESDAPFQRAFQIGTRWEFLNRARNGLPERLAELPGIRGTCG